MDEKAVNFITKMCLDELLELMATKYDPKTAKNMMIEMLEKAKEVPQEKYTNDTEGELQECADQVDALVCFVQTHKT